ncbi:MAG: cytochrome C biogenesis protein [Candidatus Spechtbacteria bacterium SB0662_bin_43]|uniref:Cytochrome C biogenesis protein n=1 Tax=Candidatus Spechtbacteria bacterium SB0662_bin_43 TaxID=2604897 RepID=A0A845DM33_9BACT|nr:cytochrome C biogenesis protein [Candidatus Spechtbacteria bacterium SB0662_bin_43]
MDFFLLAGSFIAGFLTVLAPCILPLLPVVIGGSLGSDTTTKRNPYIIIGSLAVSIIAFTLIIYGISSLFYVPDSVWRYFSATLVLIVGISFLFPSLWVKIPVVSKLALSSNRSLGSGFQKKGILGDAIIGSSLGPVFTSCSPTYFLILANVLPKNFIEGFIYLIAYAVGFCVVLLFIALVGDTLLSKLNVLARNEGRFKKIIGVLIILSAILLYTSLDKELSALLLDLNLFVDTTSIEVNIINSST